MAYELTGKIKLINEEKVFGSGFRKREVVVTVEDGKYPQDILLEFVQDKADLLNDFSPNQQVTVSFDIRGREYNGRYFNNLNGWRIQADGDQAADNSSADEYFGGGSGDGGNANAFDDDIPF